MSIPTFASELALNRSCVLMCECSLNLVDSWLSYE